MKSDMKSHTLVLNGKLAAVWQLHEDDSIEEFHFTALPDEDDNRVIGGRLVVRPGDPRYESVRDLFDRDEVTA